MFRFLLGVIVGLVAASYFRTGEALKDIRLEGTIGDWQRRAGAGLEESRRIIDETREELRDAAAAGSASIQRKAERLRRAIEMGAEETGS